MFAQEQRQFRDLLTAYEDIEAQLALEFVNRAQFILTTRFSKDDMTDEGYDFNGWILEFYQEQCNGIVQIDDQDPVTHAIRQHQIAILHFQPFQQHLSVDEVVGVAFRQAQSGSLAPVGTATPMLIPILPASAS